jgi:hypothetical protein
MTDPTANDLLMGSGIPAAKFDQIGVIVKGTIVKTGTSQQRDYQTKQPLYWNDGRPGTIVTNEPMLQAVITVQTDTRDDNDDDGQRAIYCGSRNLRDAVRDAVTKAGSKALEVGGTIAVQYTGGSGNTGDPKQYAAEYKQPALNVGILSGNDNQQTVTERPTSLLGG